MKKFNFLKKIIIIKKKKRKKNLGLPAHWPELLSSPAPVGQSAGIWRVVAGEMYARALDFPFTETGQNQFFSFRPAWTDTNWKATLD